MQYLLMLYVNEGVWSKLTQAQQQQGVAGVLNGSNRLQGSSTATTVRIANGKPQVLNGPYADSKEQLGGYYLIDVPDLDAAISWAARCPASSHGVVEVRPIWPLAV